MSEHEFQLNRRRLLQAGIAASLAGKEALSADQAAAAQSPTQGAKAASLIAAENARPGTIDWQLTYTRVDPATKYRCPWIEGYVSQASARAGDELQLFVSSNPAAEFKVDLYRLGYYGGQGGRLIQSLGPFEGRTQLDPPIGEERLRECRWEATASIKIGSDWPSGVYLGKLSLTGSGRYQSYVVFIVRDERPADIVFQCSDHTWQAYNRWPDNFSLYDDGTNPWALVGGVKVGFDRPYGKYCQVVDAPLSQGSGEFLLWEFPFAYWLEQQGYDITYVSNTDVHHSADVLTRSHVMLSVGHDEYWSLEQYRHVRQAIERGVSVGFFSGNTCCFVAPLSPNSAGVPARVLTRAGRYGGLMEVEKGRMGPFSIDGPNENLLIGARTISPFNGSGDWIVAKPDHWLFDKTGMKRGDAIPGLVGWEFHGDPAKLPDLQVVAEGDTLNGGGKPAHWTATIYPGPKGNWVFNASTIYWAQGLSSPPGHVLPFAHFGRPHGPDPRVQQITHNFLQRCGAKPTNAKG
jgi:hypothetical protein